MPVARRPSSRHAIHHHQRVNNVSDPHPRCQHRRHRSARRPDSAAAATRRAAGHSPPGPDGVGTTPVARGCPQGRRNAERDRPDRACRPNESRGAEVSGAQPIPAAAQLGGRLSANAQLAVPGTLLGARGYVDQAEATSGLRADDSGERDASRRRRGPRAGEHVSGAGRHQLPAGRLRRAEPVDVRVELLTERLRWRALFRCCSRTWRRTRPRTW